MLVLSKSHLARHDINLITKENGDVVLESGGKNNLPERVYTALGETYPDVDSDVMRGIAYKAAQEAWTHQVVKISAGTPDHMIEDAHRTPNRSEF